MNRIAQILIFIFLISFTTVKAQFPKPSKDVQLSSLLIDAKRAQFRGEEEEAIELNLKALKLNEKCDVAYFHLSQLYFQSGKMKIAYSSAKEAVALMPENRYYLKQYASLSERLGKFNEAAEAMQKLIRLYPKKAEYYYYCANYQWQDGQEKKALKTLDKYEKKQGVNERISEQKLIYYGNKGKHKKMLKVTKKLVEAFPNNIQYRMELASYYKKSGKEKEFKDTYEHISKMEDIDDVYQLYMYNYYISVKAYDKADKAIEIVMRSPKVPIDMKISAFLVFYQESFINDEVPPMYYELLNNMMEANPEEAKAWAMYGDFLLLDKEKAKASEKFKYSLKLDSTVVLMWENVLKIEDELQNYDSVIDYGKRAILLFPEQIYIARITANALLRTNQCEQALKIMKNANFFLSTNKQRGKEFKHVFCKVKLACGQENEGKDMIKKLAAAYPTDADIQADYVMALCSTKEYKKAHEVIDLSILLEKDLGFIYASKAAIYLKENKYLKAEEYLKKAVQEKDVNALIYRYYGDYYYAIGKYQLALEKYEKALQLNDEKWMLEPKVKILKQLLQK